MKPVVVVVVLSFVVDTAYPNEKVLKVPVAKLSTPALFDVVWTSMYFHDLSLMFFGSADVAAVNKGIFDALKPCGVYFVLDHAAKKGSGLRDADTLHRIDPEAVKKEVTAAGFVLEGESDVLRNPDDPHTAKVFDPAIRGKPDKFIFKFRKPAGGK